MLESQAGNNNISGGNKKCIKQQMGFILNI
jgi:hypothetical protein